MDTLFIPLFQYWKITDYFVLLFGYALAFAILCGWWMLWRRRLGLQGSTCMLSISAAVAVVPVFFYIHCDKAASLLIPQEAEKMMLGVVERRSNGSMLQFMERAARKYGNIRDFVENGVPAYAHHLYSLHPSRYLPVERWTSLKTNEKEKQFLTMLGEAVLQTPSEMSHIINCDELFELVSRHLVNQQRSDSNLAALEKITRTDYEWLALLIWGSVAYLVGRLAHNARMLEK